MDVHTKTIKTVLATWVWVKINGRLATIDVGHRMYYLCMSDIFPPNIYIFIHNIVYYMYIHMMISIWHSDANWNWYPTTPRWSFHMAKQIQAAHGNPGRRRKRTGAAITFQSPGNEGNVVALVEKCLRQVGSHDFKWLAWNSDYSDYSDHRSCRTIWFLDLVTPGHWDLWRIARHPTECDGMITLR